MLNNYAHIFDILIRLRQVRVSCLARRYLSIYFYPSLQNSPLSLLLPLSLSLPPHLSHSMSIYLYLSLSVSLALSFFLSLSLTHSLPHIHTLLFQVGLLPVPHPIIIRKYQPNRYTCLWFTAFQWGVIFMHNQVVPLFDGKKVKLFMVQTVE